MIEVRPEGAEALDELAALVEASFPKEYGEAWTRQQIAGMMALPHVQLYCARTDKTLAGFAITRTVCDECELLLIGVNPDQRRRGIAAKLIEKLTSEARKTSISKLFLEMREGNDARHLYARFGFLAIGRRADYYRGRDGRRFDAVTLALRLT